MRRVGMISIVLASSCFAFTFNASICDKIASDPNQILPQECKNYSEEEATKAFNKVKEKKKISDKEIIEFHQNEKEK